MKLTKIPLTCPHDLQHKYILMLTQPEREIFAELLRFQCSIALAFCKAERGETNCPQPNDVIPYGEQYIRLKNLLLEMRGQIV